MNKTLRKISLMLFISIATTVFVFGQTADRKWAIGYDFGVIEYSGDYGNGFFKYNSGYAIRETPLAGGLSIFRYLSPSFDLGLKGFYDGVDYKDGAIKSSYPDFKWTIDPLWLIGPELKYKLNNGYILKESSFFRPFLKAGMGMFYAKSNGIGVNGEEADVKFVKPNLSGGGGIAFALGKSITLEFQAMLNYPFNEDHLDLISNTNAAYPLGDDNGDLFLQSTVGLKYAFGKAKDSDGDGVPDNKDLCPDTPEGVMVDENGCPIDTDKDGIPDYQDDCPAIPGLKEFNGCPDTDGDGIPDKDDDCPDVAGLAKFNGCPDSDGDGVPDKDDRCPNTPKGYEVDRFGCPMDRDRDGIIDNEDDCPDEPGVAELKGCPYDVGTLMSKYGLNNKNIPFDFDMSELKSTGITTLNNIASALNNHDGFGVELSGHTDYVGSKAYNMGLSERRVNSAADYLVGKGVQKTKIKTMYFGEDNPASDNSTKEGRALNRRVDYKLIKMK